VADGIQNPISTDENSWSLISEEMIGYQCLENVPGIPNVSSCVVPKKTKPQLYSFTRKFYVGKLPNKNSALAVGLIGLTFLCLPISSQHWA